MGGAGLEPESIFFRPPPSDGPHPSVHSRRRWEGGERDSRVSKIGILLSVPISLPRRVPRSEKTLSPSKFLPSSLPARETRKEKRGKRGRKRRSKVLKKHLLSSSNSVREIEFRRLFGWRVKGRSQFAPPPFPSSFPPSPKKRSKQSNVIGEGGSRKKAK